MIHLITSVIDHIISIFTMPVIMVFLYVVFIKENEAQNVSKVSVFDFDDTLCEAVGTYEIDRDLDKFRQDNTFFNNLKTRPLPTLDILLEDLKNNNCKVVIQTAREERWWLPLILFCKGISYHHLIQRGRGVTTSSDLLKKQQLEDFIQINNLQQLPVSFYDDQKKNLETVSQIKNTTVFDSKVSNGL